MWLHHITWVHEVQTGNYKYSIKKILHQWYSISSYFIYRFFNNEYFTPGKVFVNNLRLLYYWYYWLTNLPMKIEKYVDGIGSSESAGCEKTLSDFFGYAVRQVNITSMLRHQISVYEQFPAIVLNKIISDKTRQSPRTSMSELDQFPTRRDVGQTKVQNNHVDFM